MSSKAHNETLRWMILIVLNSAMESGAADASGYVREQQLRSVLDSQNYRISEEELRYHLLFLTDATIACVERHATAQPPKYRLTAQGIMVATGEKHIRGIGASAED